MKSGLPILLALLISCGEKPRVLQRSSPPESDPALAAAQLALADSHLNHGEPHKAIPYLNASPTHADALAKILATTAFTLPVTELRHPFPILRFTNAKDDLFVAIGGKFPTVIRWNLTAEPAVRAVMFPAEARDIAHIAASPDARYLIVHRDRINLLCHAGSLKPIAALAPFPEALNPETCQPFSANSLLLASPSQEISGHITWHIHDAATGEILRSEMIRHLSPPAIASFLGTTLRITTQDGTGIHIPLQGELTAIPSATEPPPAKPPVPHIRQTDPNTLTISRTLRLAPGETTGLPAPILTALAGYALDPATQTLSEIPSPNRLETLSQHFPETVPPTLKLFSATAPLQRRLADAYPAHLPELTAPARSHADLIRRVFATGDRQAILAVIDSASPGLPYATALYLAIESQDPEILSHILAKATDIPPALLTLAKRQSSDDTDFSLLRTMQDWHGYESPDFTPLLDRFKKQRADTLAALTLPGQPTAGDISAFFLKLTSPASFETLGKPLLAEKAITAARSLSENPTHAATAIRLADLAQNLGAHPADCLRVRATALIALSDFEAAHTAWIDLITRQPVDAQLPTDYTEAAHSAFESGDPRQAIEILNTGLFRFPNAPSSAIRSAWIALLTDHTADALRYLNHATKLGLPPAEIENTTALLAIAHQRLGDHQAAASHLAQLQAISPKWNNPRNIDALPWPEPFLQSLRQIISGEPDPGYSEEPETEPWPSPENDPIDKAPLPAEFPIEEPPLPSR